MTEHEIQAIAAEVLQQTLGSSGFDHADVRVGPDQDGDASVFVTAHFKPGSGVTGGEISLDAHTALWRGLLSRGEDRFPYLNFRYPDDELLLGEDGAAEG